MYWWPPTGEFNCLNDMASARWLEAWGHDCVGRNVTGSIPELPKLVISTIYFAVYEFVLLFCLLVLHSCNWIATSKKYLPLNNNSCMSINKFQLG